MKFEYILRVAIAIFLSIGLGSCRKDAKKLAAEKIVAEWTGKEIVFPDGLQCTFFGSDTVCPDLNTPFKILLYTDSFGCTNCKLELYKWNTIIEEAEEIVSGKISFHFFFQPKDEKELNTIMRRDNFRQAVYIDSQDKLNKTNKLPDIASYQCFLLDENNKVLLIGNPTFNPAIWDLFKQTIAEKENIKLDFASHTTVEVEQTEIELKKTDIHKSSTATFVLKNTGNIPLLIKDVSSSCGCTVPEWDKKPIKPGEKTEIKVKVTPDGTGFFRKTVIVHCNTRRGTIHLSVKKQ